MPTKPVPKERYKIPARYIIYFLFNGEELVYIGKSTRWVLRIYTHWKKKAIRFDSFSYLEATKETIDRLEIEYIEEHKPKYNKKIILTKKVKGVKVEKQATIEEVEKFESVENSSWLVGYER